ncbi:hypothetical protein A4A49_56216, partial [Nicotiana attenuata]
MSLALEFEQKSGPNRSTRGPNWTATNRSNSQTSSSFAKNVPGSASSFPANYYTRNPLPSNQTTTQPQQARVWDAERKIQMAKGLCYHCNEKFSPGHRCKFQNLSLMEIADEEQIIGDEVANAEVDETPEADLAEISFHAILGHSVSATMKLQGSINQRQILILADSGSTHNFVAEPVVEELKIIIDIVPTFGVQIGNGDIIRCNKVCKNVTVQLPGLTITQDYYPFSIGGADL